MALYQQAISELQGVKLAGFLKEFSDCIILIDDKIGQSATIHEAYLDSLSATACEEMGLSIPALHEKVRYNLINDIHVKSIALESQKQNHQEIRRGLHTSKVPNLQTIDLTRFMSTYKLADKVSCSAENNVNPTELPSDVMSNPDMIMADEREEVVMEGVITPFNSVRNNVAGSSPTPAIQPAGQPDNNLPKERAFAIIVSKKRKNILSPGFSRSRNPKHQQVGNKCPRKTSTIPLANLNWRFFVLMFDLLKISPVRQKNSEDSSHVNSDNIDSDKEAQGFDHEAEGTDNEDDRSDDEDEGSEN
ncbi:hypothetical protein BGX38DRAFT_1204927 [Terfezia claveryi]|nr:hypothetical protein BGX38DRAFT_1204927 [Terfezia claveryi]